jgi:hypothetical protein
MIENDDIILVEYSSFFYCYTIITDPNKKQYIINRSRIDKSNGKRNDILKLIGNENLDIIFFTNDYILIKSQQ